MSADDDIADADAANEQPSAADRESNRVV